nr:ATP-dependent DNA helicase Q-like SIM isoform X1 [Ipomoea batatas]
MASDQVIAELVGMGFEFSDITNAVKAVGPSVSNAIEYILDGSHRNKGTSTSSTCVDPNTNSRQKRASNALHAFDRMRQSNIKESLKSACKPIKRKYNDEPVSLCESEALQRTLESPTELLPVMDSDMCNAHETSVPSNCKDEEVFGQDWEKKVKTLLVKHFGFSSLKSFQKQSLEAWLNHRDCLVLAATGSGKSLCFQIPALLTGEVVVVISPLISLMHDQCLKLAKHGISACFLGSGQIDRSVEKKAMNGLYSIIYVCPETILRLIKPLQNLVESRGIALFAIDEVHCVSKWGHDFRPDYRQLSILRENFRVDTLKSLKFDVPLMALTATATNCVREDILKSLKMSNETQIVCTSFFRPNLRFSVKHSRTSSLASYQKDFQEIISTYSTMKKFRKNNLISPDLDDVTAISSSTSDCSIPELEALLENDVDNINDDAFSENDDEIGLPMRHSLPASKERELSVEFLEDESDLFQDVDDLDVSCGEFHGQPIKDFCASVPLRTVDLPSKPEERLKLQHEPLEYGPTIIYVPTRKETLSIAKFLSKFGVKAAAYNAKFPKSHLRQVHKEFHEDYLQVVVATIAFGMGIDKSNVRRIIHYGWPQSLEAYYQEAGRAGRDGKLADCVLYANLSRIPTLLPSKRSEEQTRQAYKMLSDCFRYGMQNSQCRAKMLVEYFGEKFGLQKCLLCDVCINGPPELQNLKAEAAILMQIVYAHYGQSSCADISYDGDIIRHNGKRSKLYEKPNIREIVSRIREQHQEFTTSEVLWWRGLSRILEAKGFIRESDGKNHVQIRCPELTELGRRFLRCDSGEEAFNVYPEADMLLSTATAKAQGKPYSSFAEWGKGWADPEIRRQRLQRKRSWKSPKKRKSHKPLPSTNTVRGRLTAKLSAKK